MNNNYSNNLTRLFHSNIPMSNSRSTQPPRQVKSIRSALNRAAFTLREIKKAQKLQAQLAKNIPKLQREYYKLMRRAGLHTNANLRSGPLTANNLFRVRRVANWTKTIYGAMRAFKRTPLPHPIAERIARAAAP